MSRRVFFQNSTLRHLLGWAGMTLNHVDFFNQSLFDLWEQTDHATLFPTIFSCQYDDCVFTMNMHGLQNLRSQRNYFHKVFFSQLTRNGSEYTGASRVHLVIDDNSRVFIKANIGSVRSGENTPLPFDNRLNNLALFITRTWNRLFDPGNDNIPYRRIAPPGTAEDVDAHDLRGTAIVRNIQHSLRHDHSFASSISTAFFKIFTSRQCLSALIGLVSAIKTTSPFLVSFFGSWILN